MRSRSAEESLASNRYGWMATQRGLTWPTLTASVNQTNSFSDSDTGTEVDSVSKVGRLSLAQPLLTGTSLSVDGTWSRSSVETDTLGSLSRSLTKYQPIWSLGFSQPLFVFKRNSSLRSRKLANLGWESNQDSYWKERLNIEFESRTLYYDLLLQQETAAVERRKFESAKLVNESTRLLVKAGKLAEVELVRADIRAKQDLRKIQNSEGNLEKAMNRAKDLISLPANQTIQLKSKLTYEPFMIPLEVLLKGALENNPDLQNARRSLETTKINLGQTKEGNRPTLTTSGSYSLTRDRSDSLVPLDPVGWNVRMGVDWPLFDATQTKLSVRQGEISLKNSQRSLENQQRDLQVSVRNAYLDIKRTEEQIIDFAVQKSNAEKNVAAIRLQYRSGLTRLIDVFDAENQMRDLDLEYLNLLVAFNIARDRLKLLVGIDPADLISTRKR
ncbi:MAG: hypothetical protein KCHDKBKB_02364 [Elusimicrobia bacterium]|nr:hypothetical protein [Elusimicrobiota bacterium]